MILRQSTAVDVLIGPFVDLTDGSSAETGESPSVKLSKNGQALAAKNDATTPVHDADGMYNCELDATDTNTVGTLVLSVAASASALPVRHEFQVVEEAVYDDLYASSADPFTTLQSDAAAVQSNLIVVHSETTKILSDTTKIEGDTATISSDTAVIESDTTAIEAAGGGLTTAQSSKLTQVHSDAIVLTGMVSDVESSLVIVKSDTAAIESELILVHSETTKVLSDTTTIESDAAAIEGSTGAIEGWGDPSSDLAAIESELILVHSETTKILSDTAAIEAAGGGLTTAQSSKLTQIHSDVIVVDAAVSDVESSLVIVKSDTAAIESKASDTHSRLVVVEAAIDSDQTSRATVLGNIHSETTVILSDTTAIHSQTTKVESDTAVIESDVALLDSAHSEPSGAPAANETPLDKLAYIFAALRNKVDVTSSAKTFYDDAGSSLWSKGLSDSGTTYSEAEGS